MSFIENNFYGFFKFLLSLTNDYGLSLLFFVLILRIIMLPLSFLNFKEEIKLKKMRPKIKEITEKYKNDPLKQIEELNKIYKEFEYNPFLTLIFQFLPLPILISVFFVLKKILQEKKKILFLGVIDLSSKNIFLILLTILLQVIYFFMQKENEKENLKIQIFFLFLISLIIIQFPSIFTLYWLSNLLLMIIERKLFQIYNIKLGVISIPKNKP